MKPFCVFVTKLIVFLLLFTNATAQESPDSVVQISSRYVDAVSAKAERIQNKLNVKTLNTLARFTKSQQKLRSKLMKVDSAEATRIFDQTSGELADLQNRLQQRVQSTQYIPFLDTLKTSLRLLSGQQELLSNAKNPGGKLSDGLNKVNGLEQQLQKADEVKKVLRQQKEFLKSELQKFGFKRELKILNKQAYYYSAQINEYKEAIKDKKKLERKAVALLSKAKPFQEFMKKNSMLASLFRMPVDDPTDPSYLQSLSGLQTRVQIDQLIQQQIAAGGPGAMQQVHNNIMQAQGQLQQLKEKMLSKARSGSSSDDDMPDFRPNGQKTKSFFQRIEIGTNMQSQKTNMFLPVTSDIGLSVGYKLHDRSTVGVGASYKVGWGKSIRHMSITHQGAGLRSFLDFNLKKSLWITGGFEMNYRAAFNDIEQLKELNAWQQSGLIGISKKLSVKTKFFKSTSVQLLWDFLSYQQLPKTQPVVFRVGYGFSSKN